MRLPWEMALTLDKNWEKNGDVRHSGADAGQRFTFEFPDVVVSMPYCLLAFRHVRVNKCLQGGYISNDRSLLKQRW